MARDDVMRKLAMGEEVDLEGERTEEDDELPEGGEMVTKKAPTKSRAPIDDEVERRSAPRRKMNYERIQDMTDEEYAEYLEKVQEIEREQYGEGDKIFEKIKGLSKKAVGAINKVIDFFQGLDDDEKEDVLKILSPEESVQTDRPSRVPREDRSRDNGDKDRTPWEWFKEEVWRTPASAYEKRKRGLERR